jgi:hypothetical protein
VTTLVIGVILALLAGCSSSSREGWTKPGGSEQELGRDTSDCLAQAQTTGGGLQGPRIVVDQDRYRRCMIERGYTVSPPRQ